MKRRVLLAAVVAFSAGARADQATAEAAAISDAPDLFGQPGLLEGTSAWPSHQGRIALAGRFGGMTVGDFLGQGAGDTYLVGHLALDYSIFSWLDVGLAFVMGTNDDSVETPANAAFGADAYPRVRAAFQLGSFGVGALLGARLLAGVSSPVFDFGSTGLDARLLGSWAPAFAGESRPFRLHLNGGFPLDNSSHLVGGVPIDEIYRFANGIWNGDWWFVGAGAEWQSRFFSPFAEWVSQLPAAGFAPLANPNWLSLGVRSTPLTGLILELSGTVGVAPNFPAASTFPAPPIWLATFGVGYTFAPFTRVEVKQEAAAAPSLDGRVISVTTGEGVAGAQVGFIGAENSPVVSDAHGAFHAAGLPPGPLIVQATADGYDPGRADVVLPDSGAASVLVRVMPVPATGQLLGQVADVDGHPLEATLELRAAGLPPIVQKVAHAFSLELPVGDWHLVATSPGFLASGRDFRLERHEKVLLDLVLRPTPALPAASLEEGRIAIHQRINFAFGKAELLPDARPILDQVVDILLRHPALRVRIEGHTDDVGGDELNLELSKARAEAVRRYLVERGVAGARLEAAGYGRGRPLAAGHDAAARAQNRRGEVRIVA